MDLFMKTPLVIWVQTFSVESVTYTDLCDGAFLLDVMQQIYLPRSSLKVSVEHSLPPVDEVSDKLTNWITLIDAIQGFYHDVLREYIVLPLPDVLKIYLQSESAADDIQLTLLLMLGCAVHCERKEVFIEKIKILDIDVQQDIVECIKKITDTTSTVLPIDLNLGDDTARLLHRHITQLLKQRSNALTRYAMLKAPLIFNHFDTSSSSSTAMIPDNGSSPDSSPGHTSSVIRDPLSVIRALRQQLDEKTVDVADLTEELNDLRLTLQKLKTENVELVQEARTARIYRDELDCLRDKANRADKYEVEVIKLRERLHELDFVKLRIEELRTENHLLLETKQELEYQLSMKDTPMNEVVELEKELTRTKLQLENTCMELDMERRRRQDLVEENAQMEVTNSDNMSQLIRLEERLKSAVLPAGNGIGPQSLSEQVSETTTKTLLQLELENKRLLRKLQAANNCQGSYSKRGEKSSRDDNKVNEDLLIQNGTTDVHSEDEVTNNDDSLAKITSSKRSIDFIDCPIEKDPNALENGIYVTDVVKTSTTLIGSKSADGNDHRKETRPLRSTIPGVQVQPDRCVDVERRTADIETIKNIETENSRLRLRLESVERTACRCDQLEQTVTRLNFDLEAQRRTAGRVSDLTAAVAESEREIDGLRRLVSELRSSVATSQMEAARAESELTDLTTDRDRLKRQADVVASRTADLQRRCDELSSENARLRRSADVMTDAARRLDKRIEELTSDIEAASIEKAALIDRISELEEEYQSTGEVAEMRCRTAEQRVEELERRIEELTREKHVDRSLVTRLRQELANERLRVNRVSNCQKEELLCDKKEHVSHVSSSSGSSSSHDVSSSNLDMVDTTNDVLETQILKDRLISLERQNAAMEEERKILRERCTESETLIRTTESTNLQLTADLSSARGQISAVKPRLDRLESDHVVVTGRCAELETRNSSLIADCERLRTKVARVGEELRLAVTSRSDLEREVDDVRRRLDQQTVEVDRLRSDRAAAESARSAAEMELARMTDRLERLTLDHDELMEWKSAVDERRRVSEDRVLGDRELVDEMTAEVLQTNVRLEAERDRAREDLEQLNAELKETKEERNRWRTRCEALSDEISERQRRLAATELECSKLENKCDSLLDMNGKLDEERQMLMKQLQSMMNQVQELLTELISSKDSHASDQKTYLQQLAELRRHKEKLEEKIMEQYKTNNSTKKKNKGFGAVIARTARNVMSRGRSKNDLRTTSATHLNSSQVDLRQFSEVESHSTSDLSPNVNGRPRSPSHRSTSSDEPTHHLRWNGSSSPSSSGMRPARSSIDVFTQSSKNVTWSPTEGASGVLFEDETITLDQFLTECNRSPKSRRQMLMQKNGDDVIAIQNKRVASNRQSHWTSLLSLFHSSPMSSQQQQQQQVHPTATTSRPDLPSTTSSTGVQPSFAMSRAFSSELNLTTTSSLQVFDVNTEAERRDVERRQRQRQQRADSALDRLNRLVAVDIEPPPLSNVDDKDDETSEDTADIVVGHQQGRPDVSQSVPVVPPIVAISIDSRKYEIHSTRSSSSSSVSVVSGSAVSRSSRSASAASGESNTSPRISKIFVPRPQVTRNLDSGMVELGSHRTTVANETTASPANERLVDDEGNLSSCSTRTSVSSHVDISTGSSSGRSTMTSTAQSRIVTDLPARWRSPSSNTGDDVSTDRKCSDSESVEHVRSDLSSEQVDECSNYRESSVCI